MANTKELSLREKALKDMSKSLSLLFNSRDNLLDYVAEKIE